MSANFSGKHIYNFEYIKSAPYYSDYDNQPITETTLNMFMYGYSFEKEYPYDANRPLSKLTFCLIFCDKSI